MFLCECWHSKKKEDKRIVRTYYVKKNYHDRGRRASLQGPSRTSSVMELKWERSRGWSWVITESPQRAAGWWMSCRLPCRPKASSTSSNVNACWPRTEAMVSPGHCSTY
ncbi:hypothetical protein J4Q44_G00230240 [Coregonus suidteri]|uniref:Uncharacterized protein n=1 Tax=Coregonus suidteri TaxID=861788 RepID=A0AAN8L5U2_9TELE